MVMYMRPMTWCGDFVTHVFENVYTLLRYFCMMIFVASFMKTVYMHVLWKWRR